MDGSVVVIGAGQAGLETAAALRAGGFTGRLTLVGEERHLPYQRPPLSKSLLTGSGSPEELELRPESFFRVQRIELRRGERAVRIDRARHCVTLASGDRLRYDHLVLALGARPRPLSVPGAELDGVLSLRGLDDARALRRRMSGGRHLVVVGGGFIGLELAATARKSGHQVTVIEAQSCIMGRVLSRPMIQYLADEHYRQGARILAGQEVAALRADRTGRVGFVELANGDRLAADTVVFGIGVLPNFELAAAAGLAVGDGVLVDEYLRTSDPAIHAVGDCARFPSPYAERMLRLESVQNAADQARCVAAGICGRPEPYRAVPWFWTEQYGIRLQIAGITDGHDHTVVAGTPKQNRFSVFCFRRRRLVGVESANRPADHAIARRMLASGDPGLTPELVGRPGFDLKAHQLQPA